MTLATANIYERVVKIEVDGGLGTGTVIEHGTETFVLTAAHVLPPDPAAPVKISNRFRTATDAFKRVEGVADGHDLAAIVVPDEFAQRQLPLPLGSDDCVYSQDVLFFGFPYDLALQTRDGVESLPLVKRATVSASIAMPGGWMWLLDGLNNPGFSGGPVVFAKQQETDVRLMAVISGYRADWQRLHIGDQAQEDGQVATNSGIIIAYDIGPVVEALTARAAA